MNDINVTFRNGFYYIQYTAHARFIKENDQWFAITTDILTKSMKIPLPYDCLSVRLLNNFERKQKLEKLLS